MSSGSDKGKWVLVLIRVLVGLIQEASVQTNTLACDPPQVKFDLQTVELKLDRPALYLSWPRRIETVLEERKLKRYLTEDEPVSVTARLSGRPHML